MPHHFHAQGALEYERCMEIERRKAIKAKYAGALATASWLERQLFRVAMWLEFRLPENRRHIPSPYTLW